MVFSCGGGWPGRQLSMVFESLPASPFTPPPSLLPRPLPLQGVRHRELDPLPTQAGPLRHEPFQYRPSAAQKGSSAGGSSGSSQGAPGGQQGAAPAAAAMPSAPRSALLAQLAAQAVARNAVAAPAPAPAQPQVAAPPVPPVQEKKKKKGKLVSARVASRHQCIRWAWFQHPVPLYLALSCLPACATLCALTLSIPLHPNPWLQWRLMYGEEPEGMHQPLW